MTYQINNDFQINCGFDVNYNHILEAITSTNETLKTLPIIFYRSIDYKTTSSIVGSLFCEALANATDSIVNPIEKGHPDIIPKKGLTASEEELRNYPLGLEIKCTIGNIKIGQNLRAGQQRIDFLTGITWQAHHREVTQLLGLIWDFVVETEEIVEFNYPKVTATFYTGDLVIDDWGQISGTQGRNTKVTAMKDSGKIKMGQGWIAVINNQSYLSKYQKLLKFIIQ